MTSIQDSPGFYGKVPVRGDFVTRRLPAQFVRSWDTWLQTGLSSSREKLGHDWLDIYLTSPIWRFALSPGNCGPCSWAGILMPSVDKVGRYFPLTLAIPVNRQDAIPWLLTEAGNWFDKLDLLALSALEDGFDLDEFDRELQKLVLPSLLPGSLSEDAATKDRNMTVPAQALGDGDHHSATGDVDPADDGFAVRIRLQGLARIRDGFVRMSASLLSRFLPAYSLWCTSGSERVTPSLLAYQGLPNAAGYIELLTGGFRDDEEREQTAAQVSSSESRHIYAVMTRGPESGAISLRWRSNGCSTVGFVRKIHEDAYLERPGIGLWAVADGMGEHVAGDTAGRAVLDALSSLPRSDNLEVLESRVRECLERVNSDLRRMAGEHRTDPLVSSRIVIMLALQNRYAALWLGGGRLYRYRDGELLQVTRDYTPAIELPDQRAAAQGEAAGTILRCTAESVFCDAAESALGAKRGLEIESITDDAWDGDTYLLCSDRLMRMLGSDEVGNLLSKCRFENISLGLIDLALDRGTGDIVTVVSVRADSN